MGVKVSLQAWRRESSKMEQEKEMKELICLAVESMGVAMTIIDANGILLYYNEQSSRFLDRGPEYIGKDVYSHHKKAASSKKLETMIQAFRKGRKEPFYYKARPYGKEILVTLSPIFKNGKLIGCTQTVQLKEDFESRISW